MIISIIHINISYTSSGVGMACMMQTFAAAVHNVVVAPASIVIILYSSIILT